MSDLVDQLRTILPTEEAGLAFARQEILRLPVLDAVPVMRAGFERPAHLHALASLFERAEAAAAGHAPPVFACVSAPSQVGKTSCGEVAFATWLGRRPADTLAYLPYGQDLADDKSRRIRDDVRYLGVGLREDSRAVDRWHTTHGGGLLARGLGGGITGQPGIACLWIDDPYRNRLEAESSAHRRRVVDGVRAVVFTRRQPITSVIVSHTRWNVDDLIGWLEKEHGATFESVRVPAVDDDGTPIVTIGGRTSAFWQQQRALMGEHDWWSLMMGLPRPREGRLFKGVTFGEFKGHGQVAIGVDFAYSSRSSADYSVAVVVVKADRYYVREVVRRQCSAPEFAEDLRRLRQRYTGAPMVAYIGAQEQGTIDFLANIGITVSAKPARVDKYSRAQAAAAAWNAGHIVVPEGTSWGEDFVAEVLDFSGLGDGHDDQVDALVGAFDSLPAGEVDTRPIAQIRTFRAWEAPPDYVPTISLKRRWE